MPAIRPKSERLVARVAVVPIAASGELWPPSVRGFEEYVTESAAVGTLDAIEATLHEYRELGFDQVILAPADYEPESLQQQMSLLTDRLLPSFSR